MCFRAKVGLKQLRLHPIRCDFSRTIGLANLELRLRQKTTFQLGNATRKANEFVSLLFFLRIL